jgi:hypothetical protein
LSERVAIGSALWWELKTRADLNAVFIKVGSGQKLVHLYVGLVTENVVMPSCCGNAPVFI